MDTRIAFMPIMLLALLALGGLLLLVLAVIAARSRTSSGPPRRPAPIPPPPLDREARVDTLRQLADQRISVNEAESRLTAMGNPVPTDIPERPPRSSSSGRGCLIAILVFLALMGLGLLALLGLSYHRPVMRQVPTGDITFSSSVQHHPSPVLPNTEEENTP